ETDPQGADVAFVAGLLHDVGVLVLAQGSPAAWHAVVEDARASGRALHEVERALLGVTHAELGGYLLGSWGLPHALVEACVSHHAPGALPAHSFDVVAAVHVADSLLQACARPVAA